MASPCGRIQFLCWRHNRTTAMIRDYHFPPDPDHPSRTISPTYHFLFEDSASYHATSLFPSILRFERRGTLFLVPVNDSPQQEYVSDDQAATD